MKKLALIIPFLAILGLFFSKNSFSQVNINPYEGINPLKVNYDKVDAYALSLHHDAEKDPIALAKKLTSPFETPHEKLRVIFRWITDNIEYDLDVFCKNSANAENQSPETVLQTRKAVCIGYSRLFQKMYQSVVDSAIVVEGYSQQYASDLGKKHENPDHAWNFVRLYDHWYLLDVTWASGSVSGQCVHDTRLKHMETIKWTKNYDDFWFLTPPEFFIFSHLPTEKDYQNLKLPISMAEFKSIPIVTPRFFLTISSHYIRNPKFVRDVKYNTVFNSQKTKRLLEKETFRKMSYLNYYEMVTHHGILRAHLGNHANLQVYTELPVQSVQIDFNNERKPQDVKFKTTAVGFSFEYNFTNKNVNYLTIYINGTEAMTHLILWQN